MEAGIGITCPLIINVIVIIVVVIVVVVVFFVNLPFHHLSCFLLLAEDFLCQIQLMLWEANGTYVFSRQDLPGSCVFAP